MPELGHALRDLRGILEDFDGLFPVWRRHNQLGRTTWQWQQFAANVLPFLFEEKDHEAASVDYKPRATSGVDFEARWQRYPIGYGLFLHMDCRSGIAEDLTAAEVMK